MGVMPVGKLLLTMSVPMVLSMMVQALYNIVDSAFVAMINEEALTAVSLAFPLQNVMISLGVGTGVGVNVLCSRYLGEKKFEKANSIATHGVILATITIVLFMLLILVVTKPFYSLLTDDPLIYGYCLDYTYIIGLFCLGIFYQTMLEKLLQATGRTFYSMIAQMSGAITNIILDPIFIFGLLGIPRLEVKGAAIATVIGQIVGAAVAFYLVFNKNKEIKVSFTKFRMSLTAVKDIYFIAVPSIILASVGSVMNFMFNKILIMFSSTAAAVFGAYFKLQSIIFMGIFGMNNGLMPIISYNYGAKKPDRIKIALKYAYTAAITIMTIGLIAFQLFPNKLLGLFSASENMLEIGVPALRIISVHFIIAAYCIVSGALFQALGKAVYSMIISIMRQLLVLVPAAYILAQIGGLNAVWWSFPIAEISSCIATTLFLIQINKTVLKPLVLSTKKGD